MATMMTGRVKQPLSGSAWEPEPLELPLEAPHAPPDADPGEPAGDDDPRPGSHVIVIDIS